VAGEEGSQCVPSEAGDVDLTDVLGVGADVPCSADNLGTEASRAPVVLGTEASAPSPAAAVPAAAAPSAAALPNTGVDAGTGLLLVTGMGLLLMGGSMLAMRRRTQG